MQINNIIMLGGQVKHNPRVSTYRLWMQINNIIMLGCKVKHNLRVSTYRLQCKLIIW